MGFYTKDSIDYKEYTVKITFDIDLKNDAFAQWGLIEVQRLVEDAAKCLTYDRSSKNLLDENGNTVGTMTVKFARGEKP